MQWNGIVKVNRKKIKLANYCVNFYINLPDKDGPDVSQSTCNKEREKNALH